MQPVTFNVISVFSVRLGVFCQCCCCCLRWMFVKHPGSASVCWWGRDVQPQVIRCGDSHLLSISTLSRSFRCDAWMISNSKSVLRSITIHQRSAVWTLLDGKLSTHLVFAIKSTWRPNYFLLHDPGLIVHEKIKLLALLVHQLTLLLDIKSSLWQNAIINHNYDVKRTLWESFCCNSELYICIYICVYMHV